MHMHFIVYQQLSLSLLCYYVWNRSKELIKSAVLDNEFLRHLDPSRVTEIVDCMYPEEYDENAVVIREGTPGSTLYVMEGQSTYIFKYWLKKHTSC